MSTETVKIYSIDENDDSLEGVLIRIFDQSDIFVAQQYTTLIGSEVYADIDLDGDNPPVTYKIRLSKSGISFDGSLGDDNKTPQSIDIYSPASESPTGTNDFTIRGQTFSLPAATDPRLCRCSGLFIDHTSRPIKDFIMHFSLACYNKDQPEQTPLIVDGKLVASKSIYVKSDVNGFCQIDLFRGGEYLVLVEGFENNYREIKVPDQSSINLIELLFPVVSEITYESNPVEIDVGESITLGVTIKSSDGQTLSAYNQDVVFTSEDTSIASISVLTGDTIQITGIKSGSTKIIASRIDTGIVTIPVQPIIYEDLTVNVS
jgi:hypothetical protein